MEETWAQRADKVLKLMQKIPVNSEEEQEFQGAVWSLCQELIDLDQSGQFVRPTGVYKRRRSVG